MANESQLRILRKGVKAWNKWKIENPYDEVDFSDADLSQMKLQGANLTGADLMALHNRESIKIGADLSRTNLQETNLTEANLQYAYFKGANLREANFCRANLSRACFEDADLIYANFEGSNLEGAYLRLMDLEEQNFNGANLHWANLEMTQLNSADFNAANLEDANLDEANLWNANLHWANLHGAKLRRAILHGANLHYTNLRDADLYGANLEIAELNGAKISNANLFNANLYRADLTDADFSGADFSGASLVETTLVRTKLTGCRIYGISAWRLKLSDTVQNDLIITPENEPDITVDNLQVAQFIYLLLHNENIRQIIDTITSTVVLILGRFTPERKVVLDAIRDELRKRNYLPVMFDFEKPANRDLTETVSTLAHIAKFVIADITDAKSIPLELEHIVPDLPSVPVMPLILRSDYEFALFERIRRFPWVLEPYQYEDKAELLTYIKERVIVPAEMKVKDCRQH